MNSIFESLLLENHQLSEGVTPKKTKRSCKTESKRLIRANHIKLESRRIFEEEEFDDIDDKFDVTPEDAEESEDNEVVLVIDPEAPADEEISDEAVEDMIGDAVYKCPVCGANYLCDCDSTENESVEVDENGVPVECPICGDDSEQILIGEIAPAEGAGEEDELEPVAPDEEETDEVEEFDNEGEDFEEEDDEVIEDSLKRSRGRRARKESARRPSKRRMKEDIEDDFCPECEDDMSLTIDEPVVEDDDDAPAVEIDADNVVINLDDTRLESFMNKVIRENYKQKNASFKVTKATRRGNTLKLEYVVRSGKSRIKGTMIGEGLNLKSRRMMLKFKDKGAFTESFAKTPSFVVECIRVRNNIIPTSVRYDYKKRVNESLYRVSGKVGLNESAYNTYGYELDDLPSVGDKFGPHETVEWVGRKYFITRDDFGSHPAYNVYNQNRDLVDGSYFDFEDAKKAVRRGRFPYRYEGKTANPTQATRKVKSRRVAEGKEFHLYGDSSNPNAVAIEVYPYWKTEDVLRRVEDFIDTYDDNYSYDLYAEYESDNELRILLGSLKDDQDELNNFVSKLKSILKDIEDIEFSVTKISLRESKKSSRRKSSKKISESKESDKRVSEILRDLRGEFGPEVADDVVDKDWTSIGFYLKRPKTRDERDMVPRIKDYIKDHFNDVVYDSARKYYILK